MGDTVLCGVLLILILCHQSHSSCENVYKGLCLEQTLKNWTEASENCNLVVSNTSLNVGVQITDIPVLQHISSAPTYTPPDLHWIGATGKFTPWFELIGCRLSFLSFDRNIWNLNSKIGPVAECHQICENWMESYKEFGINETHCFCRKETGLGLFPNKSCKLQNAQNFANDLIGTSINVTIAGIYYGFAVYRKRNAATKIEDTFGECLLENNEGNKTYPCDSADSTQRTWAQRQREEINNKSLPKWTPYVRRLIISWKKGASVVQDGTVCIGVRHQNGIYEPLPLRCNETHSSICQKSDIATDTTTPRTTSSDSRTSRRRTTSAHQVTDSTDSALPLIIGSVAGFICIVLVVTIIIVLTIKRRRPNKRENSQAAPTQNVYYSEMPEDRSAQLVIEKESPQTVNNTDYDTMLSINNEKITEDSEEYGKLLPGDDNVYNHTWDKPVTEQLTDHVYSTTISGNDANVYDHTETNNANLPGVSGGDHGDSKAFTGNDASLYDHTETKCLDLPKVSDA